MSHLARSYPDRETARGLQHALEYLLLSASAEDDAVRLGFNQLNDPSWSITITTKCGVRTTYRGDALQDVANNCIYKEGYA